jgi:hypothetical protein
MKERKRYVVIFIFMMQARSLPPRFFFSFFTNRQMCSAKGNGLSDCRNRNSKKPGKEKKKETPRPSNRFDGPSLRPTDPIKKQNETKCFSFFLSFLAVCLCDGHHDTLAINPSTLPLIRIRILEGAATAICGPSNKTHTFIKVSFIRFLSSKNFVWLGGFFRESLGTIVSLYCPTGNLEERYGKYKT